MALQWIILTYVVAAEAAIALLLTLPYPKLLKNHFVSLVSFILQPSFSIIPFAAFQLLDIYWKNEHRLMCTSEVCTAAERDRYEKSGPVEILEGSVLGLNLETENVNDESGGSNWGSAPSLIYKAQRNVILCAAACLLYWCIYIVSKYEKEIRNLEEVEKRYKDQ